MYTFLKIVEAFFFSIQFINLTTWFFRHHSKIGTKIIQEGTFQRIDIERI